MLYCLPHHECMLQSWILQRSKGWVILMFINTITLSVSAQSKIDHQKPTDDHSKLSMENQRLLIGLYPPRNRWLVSWGQSLRESQIFPTTEVLDWCTHPHNTIYICIYTYMVWIYIINICSIETQLTLVGPHHYPSKDASGFNVGHWFRKLFV